MFFFGFFLILIYKMLLQSNMNTYCYNSNIAKVVSYEPRKITNQAFFFVRFEVSKTPELMIDRLGLRSYTIATPAGKIFWEPVMAAVKVLGEEIGWQTHGIGNSVGKLQ